jgi:hypothetical protein
VAAAPLPAVWVELIHSKLALIYGQRFTQQYAGLDVATLRRTWAQQLAGITEVGIKHALEHLPADYPPNVLQFRALCCNRPPEAFKALPAPKASPERVARAVEALRALQTPSKHPRAWAYALRERERQGEHLTLLQKQWWREALRWQLTSEEESA